MKWTGPRIYNRGDVRERIRFAWWPKRCDDGYTRWLERVKILEKYTAWAYMYDPSDTIQGYYWVVKEVKGL